EDRGHDAALGHAVARAGGQKLPTDRPGALHDDVRDHRDNRDDDQCRRDGDRRDRDFLRMLAGHTLPPFRRTVTPTSRPASMLMAKVITNRTMPIPNSTL